MKTWDITVTLQNEMTRWPSHPPVKIEKYRDMCCGDSNNSSSITMSVHTGTHVDAPVHFLKNGSGVESLPLELLIGDCWVGLADEADIITAQDLVKMTIPVGIKKLLLKTKNSAQWTNPSAPFNSNYVALSRDGAEWLVSHGIETIGIDYLSIQKYKDVDSAVHNILLENDVVIVEGLNLASVEPGAYQLYCLPLKIQDCDGSPARAILTRA